MASVVTYFKRLGRALFNIKDPEVIRRKPIPKKIRVQVWNKYHDTDIGECYVCGTEIKNIAYGWHCSHVVSVANGGEDTVENLRTCCYKCNLKMGTMNLYEYKNSL